MNKSIYLFLAVVLMTSLVCAAPTKFSGSSVLGIDIEHPYSTTFKIGEEHKFHFHLFNTSDGRPILANASTTCSFHLYNSSGSHLFKNNLGVSSDDHLDYEQIILGGNFTKPDEYAYVFQCNSTSAGGYYTNNFIVTPNGMDNASGIFLVFIWLLFIIAVIGLIITFILTLVKLATTSETIFGLLTSWGFFALILVTDYLAKNYINDGFMSGFTGLFISITAWSNVMLPLIALFITFFVKGTQKKKPLSVQEVTGGGRYG